MGNRLDTNEHDLQVQASLAPPVVWKRLPEQVRSRIGYASTTRGEPAEGSVYACNYGAHVGDDPNAVHLRRSILVRHIQANPVWLEQVHGTKCAELEYTPDSNCIDLQADAAFTQAPGNAAVIMTADCLPVLLTDHLGRAVAAAHCGWKGLAAGILDATLKQFRDRGLLDGPLHAWLGPCIGPRSFEVGNDVREVFIARNNSLAAGFTAKPDNPDKWLCDLATLARLILMANHHVIVDQDERDTFTDLSLNSYRRDRVTGRQATLIWLRT